MRPLWLILFLGLGFFGFWAAGPAFSSETKVYEQSAKSGQVIITKEKPPPPKQIKQSLSQLPLKRGMTGPAISQLHNLLRLAGFSYLDFSPDDVFGQNTEAAVKMYQHGENDYLRKYLGWKSADTLSATGIADKATANSLVSKTCGYELSVHVVARGDYLGKISAKFKVPTEQIASFNNFTLRHLLQIGENIYIPALKQSFEKTGS